MKILGIDPGLRVCGYACLETESYYPVLIEAGVFKTDPQAGIEFRLHQIAEDIDSVLEKFLPEVVAVEKLYSHYAHPRTAILMGHARGVILHKCAQKEINVKNFSATRIKKSITGNGRAAKHQMQKAIQTLLNLSEPPEPNDVADAISAGLCCANFLKTDITATN